MFKRLQKMLLIAAICLPWVTQAQDCTQTVTPSQPYIENFESVTGTTYSTAGSLPACWNGFTNGTGAAYVPHVVGSGTYWYTHSGTNSVGFTSGSSATYGNTKYVLLPPMNVALNQLELTFWMCTESSSYGTLYVGYVTSDDTSTFTPLQAYPASSATVHDGTGLQATAGAEYNLSLYNVPATATRLAFKWYHNSTYYSCFIDDVMVAYAPTCPRVMDLAVVPSSNAVTVSWTETGTATQWEVNVSDATSLVYSSNVFDTTFTVNNLDPNTEYTVSVRAICASDDTSLARTATFRTLCSAISSESMPYSYGFEDANGTGASSAFNPCWGRHTNYSSAYPYTSSSYVHSGSYSLYFYSTSSNYSYTTLPAFEDDIDDLYLSFWAYKTSANYGHVFVGVMSDPDNINTFDTLAMLQVSELNTWELFEVSLASYTGNGGVLALLSPQMSATSYVYIDDIIVSYPPSCPVPSNVVGSNATANTVDVSWTSSASEYIIEYGLSGFTMGTGNIVTSITNSVTLTGLTMGMTYRVYVTAICGSDTSNPAAGNVSTGCANITANDLPFVETFESYNTGTSYPISSCWTKGTNSSTAYPYPYSTAAINGSRGLYFYSNRASSATGTSYYSYAALPPIDNSVDVSDLMITFNAKRYSTTTAAYHSMILVGIADSVSGFANAAAIDTTVTWIDTIDITAEAASSIHAFELSFENYTGNGKYVVFYAPIQDFVSGTTQYNYIYIDDVVLRNIPSCFWPSDVVVAGISSESAEISWTPDPRTPNPSSWIVEYGVHGFTVGEGDFEYVYDTTVTLSNLLASTEYDVYISASCGGEDSEPAQLSFTTLCTPLDTLPLVENFDGVASGWGNTPNCWMFLNQSSSSSTYPQAYVYSSTTYAVSGNCLYFKSSNSTPIYAILPQVNSALNTLQLRFTYRNEGTTASNGILSLGYMTNPYVDTTFVEVATFDRITTLTDVEIPFGAYNMEAGTYFIAFKYTGGTASNYYLGIDNVILEPIPTCQRSTNLTADSLSYDYARLTWENYSESVSDYTVYYSNVPEFSFDTCQSLTVFDTVAELFNLDMETDYYWTVVANCGNDDYSNIPAVQHFRTLLDCGEDAVNIVGTIGEGTSSGYTYFAYNYTYPIGYSASIFSTAEMVDLGLLAGADIRSVSVHAGATACTINHLQVYIGEDTISEFTGATDTTRFGNLTLVYDGTLTTSPNEWATIEFDTSWHYSGSNNLILCFVRDTVSSASGNFYYGSTSPDYRTLYGYRSATSTSNPTASRAMYRVNVMFNLCAEVPTCQRLMDVSVVNLTDTSATFSWEASSGNYQYVYGPQGFDLDAATLHTTLDTFVVLNGLTQNTVYDFYVRSVCAAGLESDWSILTRIQTPCAPQPLPYTENFETYGSGSTQPISACWVKGTSSSTAYPYPYSSYVVNGSRSLYFYAYMPSSTSSTPIYSYAALPLMQAPVDTLMVSFNMLRYNSTSTYYTSRMVVGVMTDPSDIATFVGVDTIDLYDELPGSVHSFEVLLDSYTGNGQFIAFCDAVPPLYGSNTYSYSYVSLDDIVVDYIPSCRRIIDITVDSTGFNTANISWTYPYPAGGYEIEYGPEDFVPGTGTMMTSATTSITLTGLSASTGYDFYVRPVCSATETGPWSFVTTFRTVCGIYNVPFMEDFESYGSGSSYPIDPCWSKGTSSTTAYPYPSSTAINGSRSLYFYGYQPSSASTTPVYSYVALPEFNVGVDSLELSFKMKRYTSSGAYYTSRLLVGVMTDPDDIATFVCVDTIDLYSEPTGSIHDINVTFDNYIGDGKHIAIYDAVPPLYGTSTYSYSYVYIDDIVVDRASPCGRPYNLTATATDNTLTVDWTDSVGATQWQIEYGATGFSLGSGTIVTASQKPYTITGLTPSTLYDVYVRSICNDGSVGGNSNGIFTVSTTQVPATLPYLYDFESSAEWSNWQTVSNNTVGWYRGTAEAAEGSYGLYVSTDSGATCNSLHSTITNAAVYRDIDFGTTPSSFEVTFLAKSAGVNDGNYEGINVMLVDPTVPVEASSTSLTSPWGSFNVVHVVRDTNWEAHTLLFDNISGVQRLVFNWYTSTTSTHPVWEGAGAIDSIAVTEQSCPRPMNNSVTDIGSDFVTLSWDGPSNADYLVRLREVDGTTNIDNPVSTNSITVNNLTLSTHYYAWVYRVCDTNNYSYSAPRIEFSTTCTLIDAVDTVREDFDSVTGTAYNEVGELPDCWEGYSNGTSDDYWPHVTNGNTYSYSVTGNAITLTSGSGTTYGNTKILRLPKFTEPVNTLTMSYWYCTESSTVGTLYVGYMTGFDYENDFVPIVTHPASQASYHSGNGPQTAGHGVFDTVSFDSVPSTALFIAFKWFQDGTFYSVCIDDVEVTSTGNYCRAPEANISEVTYSSATLNWSSNSETFEVAVKAANEGVWPTETTVSNATSYSFTGLQPATVYNYRIRAICDATEGMVSEWTEGSFTTDSLPCIAPASLQNTAVDLSSATFDWTVNGEENAWRIYVWNATFSQSYDVTSHPATISGLTQTTSYYATVVAVCGGGLLESETSDTVQFTTATCQPVTNVVVSNITTNSATVNWNGSAASYSIEYGMGDFEQGTGTFVSDITGTSYTIQGLTDDRNYSVYVRANCDAANYSVWSDRVQFRTEAVGIADVEGVNLTIYPNPTSDNTTIALSGVSGEVTITIVDLSGRTVKTDSMSCEGDCVKTVAVSGLAEGAYFVRVSGENVNMVKKLVVK